MDGIDLVLEKRTIYRPEYSFKNRHVIKLIKSLTDFTY